MRSPNAQRLAGIATRKRLFAWSSTLSRNLSQARPDHLNIQLVRRVEMNQWRASFRCLTLGTAVLLAACASQKAQISPEVTSGLTLVRAQAVQIKQQLTRTNESGRTLSKSSGSELPSSLDAVSANLDSLDSTLGVTRQAVRSVQDQVAAYFFN